MRLASVSQGNRSANRAFLWFLGRQQGHSPPDVVKTIHYRSGFWGAPWTDALNDAMRGPSDWSVGERELFAAFTSSLNQCHF
jgi:hypothetical protein